MITILIVLGVIWSILGLCLAADNVKTLASMNFIQMCICGPLVFIFAFLEKLVIWIDSFDWTAKWFQKLGKNTK